MALRKQIAEAALEGFLDAALAGDLTTAKNNGYKAGRRDKNVPADTAPVDGVNR